MMPAELQHPGIFLGRLAQDGDVVKVFAEEVAAQSTRPASHGGPVCSVAGRWAAVTRWWTTIPRRRPPVPTWRPVTVLRLLDLVDLVPLHNLLDLLKPPPAERG